MNWLGILIPTLTPLAALYLFFWQLRLNDLRHIELRLSALEQRLARIEGHLGVPPHP